MAFTAALNIGAAAASVGQAIGQGSPTHRQCLMYITNGCSSYSLSNPRWYIYSGSCASPLPPMIPSNASGSALFIKTPHTACGSVGVITYDLLHDDSNQTIEKISIMFSNPYDFNVYSNWYAVGIFDESKQCDYDLYNEMYYEASESFVRGQADGNVLVYKGKRVTIQATMSDAYQPVMKVTVNETD
uniref:DELTA-sagatoxin-Srs1a n=1 Tax=Salarias fasciatus TaxID=181472 RepID=A0A672FKF7_SALFA